MIADRYGALDPPSLRDAVADAAREYERPDGRVELPSVCLCVSATAEGAR
jgi:hypothetical protein